VTGSVAVALHDVEPATYDRCALVRDWLSDLGIDRMTLLVIPAADGHPFFQRRPDLAAWLLDRRDAGDAVAQHGLRHRRGGRAAEYPGLDARDTEARLAAGRRVLALAGLEPRGFVAPAYAYTPALRHALRQSFDWWATLMAVTRPSGSALAPAWSLGRSTPLKRALSPAVLRVGAWAPAPLLRLDLHPADFDSPRHVHALEAVLRGARRRRAVTYDDLA